MQSIILDPGVIELVLNDAKDFLASKAWYAERGQFYNPSVMTSGAQLTWNLQASRIVEATSSMALLALARLR